MSINHVNIHYDHHGIYANDIMMVSMDGNIAYYLYSSLYKRLLDMFVNKSLSFDLFAKKIDVLNNTYLAHRDNYTWYKPHKSLEKILIDAVNGVAV